MTTLKAFFSLFLLFYGAAHAEVGCETLIEGTPRGLQCLHCMYKNAKGHAEQYTRALLLSCRQNLAVAYVMDGAFGFNANVINEQVKTITSQGRDLNLHLYILNGPAQRRWFKKAFVGFANRIPPNIFREKIERDKKFQREYMRLVKKVVPIMRHAHEMGATLSVVPMLEDNLTNRAFNKLLELTILAIPKDLPVQYVRNACSDCYPGNEFAIPKGLLKEDHWFDADFVQDGGYVSNDGSTYVYFIPSERIQITKPVAHGTRFEESLSLDQLLPKLRRADNNGSTFLLWLSKFQNTLPGSRSALISEREFPLPNEFEVREISRFLGSSP